eukprot:scaffold129045_cov15-Tisochrysis_lutea.AAC.1
MGGQIPLGPKALRAWSLMSASGRQKRCRLGNQVSTMRGHNLSMKICSACFLGMSARFGGPKVQDVAPGEQ